MISNCDDWDNFPNFKGITREVNCEEWDTCDMREHHKWWLKYLPNTEDQVDGIFNNWWYYLGDPNHVA